MTDHLVRVAPAKVNLFLRVLGREIDGYHAIETVMTTVDLTDTLTITRTATGVTLDVDGPDLGPVEQNLAWRAATAILAATGQRFGVHLHLQKRIPAGAGLGGGSSDAAQALLGVNALANHRVPPGELLTLAARLGADVPFLVSQLPAALGWGRGQRLLAVPHLVPRPALLILPAIPIATTDAYGWFAADEPRITPRGGLVLTSEQLGDWSALARMAGNALELPVLRRHPVLRDALDALVTTRPLLARMSGSGSTLFAVYRTEQDRDAAVGTVGQRHGRTVRTTIGGGSAYTPR